MMYSDKAMKGFPERIYVSTQTVYLGSGMSQELSAAFDDLDQAVDTTREPKEVGIYQLVRVAKFQKTAVEIKSTVKEIINDTK
jgi:hypothetical protein